MTRDIDDANEVEELVIETEDGFRVNPDAPDDFKEWAENNTEHLRLIVEFGTLLGAGGHNVEDYSPIDCKKLSEYHYSKVDEAIDDGDLEAAKRHKDLANEFERVDEEYTRLLLGDGDE